METGWIVAGAVIKAILAIAPFFIRQSEFNLTGLHWDEARDAINVFACRCILATVPTTFGLLTLEYASDGHGCAKGLHPLIVMCVVLAGVAIVFVIMKLPHNVFRGDFKPILVTVVMIVVEAVAGRTLVEPATKWLCSLPASHAGPPPPVSPSSGVPVPRPAS